MAIKQATGSVTSSGSSSVFAGFRFPREVIVVAVVEPVMGRDTTHRIDARAVPCLFEAGVLMTALCGTLASSEFTG
jgi:hypothetical protein